MGMSEENRIDDSELDKVSGGTITGDYWNYIYKCSSCGGEVTVEFPGVICPHCGAGNNVSSMEVVRRIVY